MPRRPLPPEDRRPPAPFDPSRDDRVPSGWEAPWKTPREPGMPLPIRNPLEEPGQMPPPGPERPSPGRSYDCSGWVF